MASSTLLSFFPIIGFSYAFIAHLFFYITALVVCLVSASLYYHWFKYGISVSGTFVIMVLYGSGTLFLLAAGYGLLLQL